MWRLRQLAVKLYHFLRPARAEQELTREVAAHLGLLEDEFRQRGMTADAARLAARRSFGGVEQAKERSREQRSLRWLEDLWRDVRYAMRALIRTPGSTRGWRRERAVTAVIVAILTVGVSANAIMFGVVDQLLLQPPSGVGNVEAVRRVYFGTHGAQGVGRPAVTNDAYPIVAALRDQVPAFSAAAAISRADVSVGTGVDARPVRVALVNAPYFSLLGLRPAAGRFFAGAEDAEVGAAPVAVVSYRFWRAVLGGDRDAVGTALRVEGVRVTVIGVAPRQFAGISDEPTDLWVPIGALAPTLLGDRWASNPGWYAFELVARLAPEVTPVQADAQATAIYRSVVADRPFADDQGTAFTAPLERLRSPNGILAEGQVGLWLLAVAGVVLLIAVANVASLLLTRTWSRRREIAVRIALGVSRARLVRQLLIESTLLAALAAAVALGVAYLGGRVVQQLLLPGFPWDARVIDARVLVVTLVIGVLTAVGAGMAPAWQAWATDLVGSVRGTLSVTRGRTGLLRTGLLVAQVALCAVLLIGTGLFMRSLLAAQAHDVGIDLDRVIQVRLPHRPDNAPAVVEADYVQAMTRLAGIPGVEQVTLARGSAPMAESGAITIRPEGWTHDDTRGRPMPGAFVVEPHYFATLGASLERGRGLTAEDVRAGSRVAVINRSLVADFWPGTDPLGQCVRLGDAGNDCTRIVGIVEDILMYDRLDTARAQVYVGLSHPDVGQREPRAMLIRTTDDARGLLPVIRQLMQSLSPDMPFVPVNTLETLVAPQLQPWRLGTTMLVIFGGAALIIAAVGLYSAMAHAVAQRSHEMGIRIALGAPRSAVVSLVATQGLALTGVGLAIGLAGAFASTGLLESLLFGVPATDPVTFVAIPLVLFTVAGLACYVPARQATRVDPMTVLRAE